LNGRLRLSHAGEPCWARVIERQLATPLLHVLPVNRSMAPMMTSVELAITFETMLEVDSQLRTQHWQNEEETDED
jgi:hypothetical protein